MTASEVPVWQSVLGIFAAFLAYFRGTKDSGANKSNPPPKPRSGSWSSPLGPQRQAYIFKPKAFRRTAKASQPRTSKYADGNRVIPTTKRHLWLLDCTVGDVVTNERLATELGIEPVLGWHTDPGIILAVLMVPGSFWKHRSGPRLGISERDYRFAELAKITHQAVPILSQCDGEWRFEGFFRFGRVAKYSVARALINGAPPELLDLKNARSNGGS